MFPPSPLVSSVTAALALTLLKAFLAPPCTSGTLQLLGDCCQSWLLDELCGEVEAEAAVLGLGYLRRGLKTTV